MYKSSAKLSVLCAVKLCMFLSPADFFSKLTYQKYFRNKRLGPDQVRRFVRPDLSPNCSQSACATNPGKENDQRLTKYSL